MTTDNKQDVSLSNVSDLKRGDLFLWNGQVVAFHSVIQRKTNILGRKWWRIIVTYGDYARALWYHPDEQVRIVPLLDAIVNASPTEESETK